MSDPKPATSNPPNEDLFLRDRCAAGDPEATEELVRQYSGLVYHSVQHALRLRHVSCSREDLKDLHNTVFLLLFDDGCRKLRQYKGINGCTLASWIRLISVRTVLNHLRKNSLFSLGGTSQLLPLEEIRELEDKRECTWSEIQKAEQIDLMKRGIRTLPSRDRLFFRLYFEKGLSLSEISEVLQITIQNMHTIKHRAIRKLKAYVAEALET